MRFRIFLTLFLLISLPLGAQEQAAVLTVQGTAAVPAKPDMALVSVGVDVKAATAKQALVLNSTRMAKVLALLKTNHIAANDIQTSQFSLRPVWNNQAASYDKPLDIAGFQVTNVVQVRVRNLDLVGPVIDGLTRSGANRIQGVSFGVTEPAPFLDKARVLAVKDALRKARLYADAAGLRLGAILSITEVGAATIAYGPQLRAMADAVPLADGEMTLRAQVTVRFSLN